MNALTIDARFDVGGGAVFFCEHLCWFRYLRAWWDDQGDHACAATSGFFEALDEFFELPELELGAGGHVLISV